MYLGQDIKNEGIVLANVFKWLLVSMVAGALTGGVIGGFLLIMQRAGIFVASLPDWRFALIPVGLLGSIYAVRLISPAAEGRGTDKVIAAIHYRASRIPFSVVPAKMLSTFFTLVPGGVVGTEGPGVQIGAGFTSALAIWLRFHEKERKKLVACGIAAALSAILGAPVGGAIFGIEVLFVGEFFYPLLLPAIVSSVSSYFVCVAMGVSYAVPEIAVPALSFGLFLWCVAAAVFFSLVCIYHVETLRFISRQFQNMNISLILKSFISSGILLCVAAVWDGRFLGMGLNDMRSVLAGQPDPWYAFLLKSVLLAVTLSGGGSGGVMTPTLYIGAAAGGFFASVLGLDVGFFAALGVVACVSGSVNTPLAAIFMAVELFGSAIAPYAGLVCIVCYMLTGMRSLYPTQILVQPKSDEFVLADPKDRRSWKIRPRMEFQKKFKARQRKKGVLN